MQVLQKKKKKKTCNKKFLK